MTVKELLTRYDFMELMDCVHDQMKITLYFPDFMAFMEAYDQLTNKHGKKTDPKIPQKYSIESMVAIHKEKPTGSVGSLEGIPVTYFFALKSKASGRNMSLSPRFVKDIESFSECEVQEEIPGLTPIETAARIALSFAVLTDAFQRFAEGMKVPAASYLVYLEKRGMEGEEEDDEETEDLDEENEEDVTEEAEEMSC